MQNRTLLIIGENKELTSEIKDKANLKRTQDKIAETTLKGLFSLLKNCTPDIILFLIESPDDTILLALEQIKKMPKLNLVPVLFFVEKKYDKVFMQKAFGLGLDDFIYCPVDETEISLRIKMNLKRRNLMQGVENQRALLRNFNVIDVNDFYMPEFASNIFDVIAKNAVEYNDMFLFMLFSTHLENKEKLLEQLKNHSRISD